MDAFPLILTGTIAGSAAFSAVAGYLTYKGLRNVKDAESLDDTDYKEKTEQSKGITRRTNVLSVFPNGVIRTREGGYVKGYRFLPSETFYAGDDEVRRLYDGFARLLTNGLPKDAVIQFRFDNQEDAGNLLNEQMLEMSANQNECDPIAQILKQEELGFYFELAANKNFRFGSFTVWVYMPSAKKGTIDNNFNSLWKSILTGNVRGVKENFYSNKTSVVTRYLEDEEKCYEKAARHFRNFEQNFPLAIKGMSFDETCVQLRISHNPNALSIPVPPQNIETDWQSYLCRTAVKHEKDEWYLWHGATPVTVVTMFEPPESSPENPTCYPGLMKFLTTNPTLRGRCTVIPEYICQDKDESIEKLKKDIKNMKRANTRSNGQVEFKDEKVKRIYVEKKQMLTELTSPGKSLIPMRFHIVVRGLEVKYKAERKANLKELEDRAQDIIKLINTNMSGSQADLEDKVAIRDIYEKLLIGEISPQKNHREITEQALSLACFIPAESDWKGITKNPHNFYVNTSGELIGVNLLRNEYAASPLTIVLGSSGSGKSVLAADLISGFLGKVPNARVRACDYGGSLAPLVNLFQGRYFRFSEKDRRTINVWDYDGLEQRIAPDDEQIELVVKDTLILLGADERSETGKDFLAVLEKCVRQVYTDEVPRNAPGRRHEPTLSHLIRKLRSFPFESAEERQTAQRAAARLENFEGNPWVDAPTDESYRQHSRFDVFELSSLDKLPDALRSCIAFRIGARVGTGDEEIEGFHPPTLVVYDEVHEYVKNEYLAYALRGAEKTTRHGRKKNKIPLLITHSFDDIKDFAGFTSNIGSIFCGKQDDITSLKNQRRWNDTVEQTILGIDNRKGVAHQFLYATGQGDNQKMTMIQVYLPPTSLWTFTTDPPEDEARKVMANALPHWSLAQRLVALAQRHPHGLAYENRTKLDEEWLLEIVNREQQHNPQFRQYLKQMNKLNQDILTVPEDIDFELLAEEMIESIEDEINTITKENFGDLHAVPSELQGFNFDIPGAVVVQVQEK